MAGKHTGPMRDRTVALEGAAWWFATVDIHMPLVGRHHKTCAPAIIRAEYHRWNASTERTHARKEDTWSGSRSTTPSPSTPRS